MIITTLWAVKVFDPRFGRAEVSAETGENSWLNVELSPGDHERICRRELDELLGIGPTGEAPTIPEGSWPMPGMPICLNYNSCF